MHLHKKIEKAGILILKEDSGFLFYRILSDMFLLMTAVEISFEKSRKRKPNVFLRKICLELFFFCKNFHVSKNLLSVRLYFLSLYRMLFAGNHKKETSLFQRNNAGGFFMEGNTGKCRWKCLTLWVVAAVLFCWGLIRFLLPDDMTLMAGRTTAYNLRLPVSVKTEESVEVLGISAKPTADNFHLSLGTEVSAEAHEAGSTEVTFYLFDKVPVKTVSANILPDTKLIPCGRTVGVQMDTDGLLVLGTGFVEDAEGNKTEPCKGILQTGDLIQSVDGKAMPNKEAFLEAVGSHDGTPVQVAFVRDGVEQKAEVTPVYSPADGAYKLGIWIRDSIQGIGTVTFFDETTDRFGALGHGIYDVDTGGLMSLKQGHITSSHLTEIVKGQKGEPGELNGIIEADEVLGDIEKNTEVGIYGTADTSAFTGESYPIALQDEIQEGKAQILSNIAGDEVRAYDVEIEQVHRFGKESSKGMVIHVTDPDLLSKTGGIVQGMSGSPILQNGKLVGAVTHVFVNDPTRGYGIFIENMLEAAA